MGSGQSFDILEDNNNVEMKLEITDSTYARDVSLYLNQAGIKVNAISVIQKDVPLYIWIDKQENTPELLKMLLEQNKIRKVPWDAKGTHRKTYKGKTMQELWGICASLSAKGVNVKSCSSFSELGDKSVYISQ